MRLHTAVHVLGKHGMGREANEAGGTCGCLGINPSTLTSRLRTLGLLRKSG